MTTFEALSLVAQLSLTFVATLSLFLTIVVYLNISKTWLFAK